MNNVTNSLRSAPLFNIQYPNSQRGMFSLREPFKDMSTEIWPTESREPSSRKLTPAFMQPTNSSNEQIPPPVEEKPVELIPEQPRIKSKRNAGVQCSLLTPNNRHNIAVQTKIDRSQQPIVKQTIDDNDITSRYYHQRKLQPIEKYEKVYEIWDIEPEQAIPINQTIRRKEIPRERYIKHRRPIIEYPDDYDFESDYDDNEQIIYARQPQKANKKTYLPSNVRMICVRDDPNRISY